MTDGRIAEPRPQFVDGGLPCGAARRGGVSQIALVGQCRVTQRTGADAKQAEGGAVRLRAQQFTPGLEQGFRQLRGVG